jgi:hypothetical protein
MKQFLKNILVKFTNNIFPLDAVDRNRPVSIQKILWDEARHESADFCRPHLNTSLLFNDEDSLRRFVISQIPGTGLILEFGVYQAHSLNLFAQYCKERGDVRMLYGFDSFEGLEEEWFGHFSSAADFDLGGALPKIGENVKLFKGWIDKTLPHFLESHSEAVALIHIDTDTYTPAKHILLSLKDRLVPGSIILFDDFYGYPNWQNGEYRAFKEVLGEHQLEYIAFGSEQVAFKIVA